MPLPMLPSSCSSAMRAPCSVTELITSITASAWLKSSLPFIKARFVNSPPSAGRRKRESTESVRFAITRLP